MRKKTEERVRPHEIKRNGTRMIPETRMIIRTRERELRRD